MSNMSMGWFREWVLLVAAMSVLSIFSTADEVRRTNSQSTTKTGGSLYFPPSCTTDQPLYADRDGKPIWLNTNSLLKMANHCSAPKMPALANQARIEGDVFVDILVNDKGRVQCVRQVSGHPLLTSSAMNAAKDWTFHPIRRDGKAVWFYGHLRFHFSTGEIKKDENTCTVAHW